MVQITDAETTDCPAYGPHGGWKYMVDDVVYCKRHMQELTLWQHWKWRHQDDPEAGHAIH